uniref:unspecific monooxygenase n=1 Tax=Streltzoviella insularis TaxID=1206366 RepID=A0A7D5YKA1_9NEOP|nr:cytochrome P450 13 [Streltzoviella insularis]
MKYSWYRGISWSSIFFIPSLVDIFRFKMFPQNTIDSLSKIFRTIVAQRGGYDREKETNNDLLDALLNIKRKADKEGISEDLLIAQAFIFLQGGFDTSSVVLTFATYELAFQPHIQRFSENIQPWVGWTAKRARTIKLTIS